MEKLKVMSPDKYLITIEIAAEHEEIDRSGDIEHALFMGLRTILPYTVKIIDLTYKVNTSEKK